MHAVADPLKPVAELLANCILGHHAGLPVRRNTTDACLDRRIENYRDRLDPAWREAVSVDLAPVAPEIMALTQRPKGGPRRGLSCSERPWRLLGQE